MIDGCVSYFDGVAAGPGPEGGSASPLNRQETAKKSTFGLTPAQLGRLLAVSAWTADSADAMMEDQANARLLQEYLNRRLADEPLFVEEWRSGTSQPATGVQPLLNRSVKETLLDPHCDLAVLKAIKDHSKRLSAMVASGSQTLIAATIYYGAVASAMVYHDQRISQYTYENLGARFLALTQRSWVDRELQELFTLAAAACRRTRTDRT